MSQESLVEKLARGARVVEDPSGDMTLTVALSELEGAIQVDENLLKGLLRLRGRKDIERRLSLEREAWVEYVGNRCLLDDRVVAILRESLKLRGIAEARRFWLEESGLPESAENVRQSYYFKPFHS